MNCLNQKIKSCSVHFSQHALRLLAFGQIHRFLEVDPLPTAKPAAEPKLPDGEGWCFDVI